MQRVIPAFTALTFLAHGAAAQFARSEKLALRSAVANQTTLPRYGKLELTLDLSATYENPFDPDEMDVHASFISPRGRTNHVHGFLDQPFTRRLEKGSEILTPAGPAVWRIRFTPDTEGTWRYQVFARDRSGSVQLPEARFEVTASDHPGFIRRSKQNPRMFAYENGKPFFAVGENMCWGGQRGSFDYDDWLPALAQAGGNWIRIWMSSWNCALEWSREEKGDWRRGRYHGVGIYSLDNAWKLDTILDTAERLGVSVMLCFGTYGEFNEGGYFNEGQWKANPYNAANGGPCAKPGDFWTTAPARKLYRQRLRYLAARYGHRPNIHAWEFWNEARAPASWVAEMAQCLKGTEDYTGQAADPYGHLLSTTYGTPEVWNLPEIDFTQSHHYGKGDVPDHAPVVRKDAVDHARFGKPHLMAEFGIDWRGPDQKYDPDAKAVNLHNALWASALSGNAGGAMIWWWDSYVHPRNLYAHLTPLRRFADQVPWAAGEWKPLDIECHALTGDRASSGLLPVNVNGLAGPSLAVIWAQNAAHHWQSVFEKKPVPPVPPCEAVVRGLPPGTYTVEWWDTWQGEVSRRATVASAEGLLRLRLPELTSDIAARILPETPR